MREETGTGARRSWPMDMALLWAAGAGSRWDRRGPAGTGGVLPGQSGRGTEHAWELSQPRGKTLGCSSFTSGSLAEGGWQLQLLPLTLALRESPQAGHRRCWREEALVAVLEWGAAEEIWRGSPKASATAASAKCFHFC